MTGKRLNELYLKMLEKKLISTKKDFCEQLGIDYGSLGKYFSGKVNVVITENNYQKYRAAGINIDWLLTGEGEMFRENHTLPASSARIPVLRQRVSCGPGQEWQDEDIVDGYIEPFGAFPSLRNAKLYAFRVSGTSMVGAGINDGDIVLFDAASGEETARDDLYVFAFGGAVYCKLLKFEPLERKIRIYSLHSPELDKAELVKELSAEDPSTIEDFHLFGRVLAWLHENRLMWR